MPPMNFFETISFVPLRKRMAFEVISKMYLFIQLNEYKQK